MLFGEMHFKHIVIYFTFEEVNVTLVKKQHKTWTLEFILNGSKLIILIRFI